MVNIHPRHAPALNTKTFLPIVAGNVRHMYGRPRWRRLCRSGVSRQRRAVRLGLQRRARGLVGFGRRPFAAACELLESCA
jgi:hypothetical protein